ncbi:MAG TPA: hypothetical protein VFC63_21230 [Blastocatellia bacterium]|nr:hypothetical protein [Blastocatellia bacterium]
MPQLEILLITLPSGRKVATRTVGKRFDTYRQWLAQYPSLRRVSQESRTGNVASQSTEAKAEKEYLVWVESVINDHVVSGLTLEELKTDARDMWFLWVHAMAMSPRVDEFIVSAKPDKTAQAYCDLTVLISKGIGRSNNEQN